MTSEQRLRWFNLLWTNNGPFCKTCYATELHEDYPVVPCRRLDITKKYRLAEFARP